MGYKPGDSYYAEFTTSDPTTGAAANATGTPVATPNHNGTDDGTFSLTVTNIDTGRYKVTGTIPVGYARGDVVNISVSATVGGIAGKQVIDSFVLDPAMILTSAYDFAKGTVAVTESYAADGAAPTPVQALLLIQQALTDFTISGTSLTVHKLDGTTQAAVLTLNDGTSPTAATRTA